MQKKKKDLSFPWPIICSSNLELNYILPPPIIFIWEQIITLIALHFVSSGRYNKEQ